MIEPAANASSWCFVQNNSSQGNGVEMSKMQTGCLHKGSLLFHSWAWPAVVLGSVWVCLSELLLLQSPDNSPSPFLHLCLVCSKGESIIKREGNCQQPLAVNTQLLQGGSVLTRSGLRMASLSTGTAESVKEGLKRFPKWGCVFCSNIVLSAQQ